jgi:hypothetical protein
MRLCAEGWISSARESAERFLQFHRSTESYHTLIHGVSINEATQKANTVKPVIAGLRQIQYLVFVMEQQTQEEISLTARSFSFRILSICGLLQERKKMNTRDQVTELV